MTKMEKLYKRDEMKTEIKARMYAAGCVIGIIIFLGLFAGLTYLNWFYGVGLISSIFFIGFLVAVYGTVYDYYCYEDKINE